MARELVKIEPIRLPDLRKPTATVSWPAWLTTQNAALAVKTQRVETPTGTTFRDVPTLPANLMPNDAQRAEIENHRGSLHSCLQETPESDERFAAETLATVTKMLLVLGGTKASAEAGEAKAEAYMVALEDVPSWAVVAVSRRWYRGDVGKDKDGRPYDTRFMPDPAAVRRLAMSETFRVRNKIAELDRVLCATVFIDCSEDLKRGKLAMDGFWDTWRRGGSIADLTFDKAVARGTELGNPDSPAKQQQQEAAE